MSQRRSMSQRKLSNHEETPFISGSQTSDATDRVSKRENFSRSMRMEGFAGDYGGESRSSGWKGMLKSMSWSGGLSRLIKADNRERNDPVLLGKPPGKPKKRISWLPKPGRRNPIQGL